MLGRWHGEYASPGPAKHRVLCVALPPLQLDGFLENMLRSRISRRVMAEQHINLASQRPGYIGAPLLRSQCAWQKHAACRRSQAPEAAGKECTSAA